MNETGKKNVMAEESLVGEQKHKEGKNLSVVQVGID